MRISVIGCGYLGAVHAAGLAALGHEVVGVDVDPHRIATLHDGAAPFFEPGLDELLLAHRNRLRFTTDIAEVRGCAVHFIAVGTPPGSDGASADLSFVHAAIDTLSPQLQPGDLVVGKSTVPVGTANELAARLAPLGVELAWNPEFLREGRAVDDTLRPDRLVYGVADDGVATSTLDAVYAPLIAAGVPRLVVDRATAELVKTAANAFLATKISFINAMADVADAAGADVTALADALGLDARIGRRFLNAGLGFGGGCLPKDIRAFRARAEQLGVGESLAFLDAVDRVNLARRDLVIDRVVAALHGEVRDRPVAVWGLAFKPDSDDVRDSPALEVAQRLHAAGARVTASDPVAIHTARYRAPELTYAADPIDAARDAQVLVVATEWQQYRDIDPRMLGAVTRIRTVIDARNCLDADRWVDAGWTYRGLGRPARLGRLAVPAF